MLCENCHADNLKNALYCKSCGTEMAKGQKPADASNQDITAVKALLDLKSRQLKDLGDEVAELKNSVAGLADRFGFAEKELGTLTGTLETTAKESEGRALKAAEMKVASIRERMQKLEKSVDSVGPRSREIMSRLFLQFEKEFKNETEALRKENGQKLAAAVGAAQNRIEQAAGKLEQAAQKSVDSRLAAMEQAVQKSVAEMEKKREEMESLAASFAELKTAFGGLEESMAGFRAAMTADMEQTARAEAEKAMQSLAASIRNFGSQLADLQASVESRVDAHVSQVRQELGERITAAEAIAAETASMAKAFSAMEERKAMALESRLSQGMAAMEQLLGKKLSSMLANYGSSKAAEWKSMVEDIQAELANNRERVDRLSRYMESFPGIVRTPIAGESKALASVVEALYKKIEELERKADEAVKGSAAARQEIKKTVEGIDSIVKDSMSKTIEKEFG